MTNILHHTGFTEVSAGWNLSPGAKGVDVGADGTLLSAPEGETVELWGTGVHTRNGDSIELRFRALDAGNGWLRFGFDAEEHEYARVEVDFQSGTSSLSTSDWRLQQPLATAQSELSPESHTLLLEKTEGKGDLVKNAHLTVYFDGERIMRLEDLDLLPEMSVLVQVSGACVLVEEFVQRGSPSGIPEYLHVGGYQVLNIDDIEQNLESICRGVGLAAEAGVELLVTPEMSLTGLYPMSPRTREPQPVAEAERRLRRFIRELPDAPHVIVGLPIWEAVKDHDLAETRYIASRVYDPDGEILYTARKVHSAEREMWHGYRLNEFDIRGVPMTLYICHDHRYPSSRPCQSCSGLASSCILPMAGSSAAASAPSRQPPRRRADRPTPFTRTSTPAAAAISSVRSARASCWLQVMNRGRTTPRFRWSPNTLNASFTPIFTSAMPSATGRPVHSALQNQSPGRTRTCIGRSVGRGK